MADVIVPSGEWQRQPVQRPLHEHVDRARPEPVTDGLQGGRVLAGGEPVGQRGVNPSPARSACRLTHSCPLTQILAG